jgi:RND family efflux transporter MFP subunit
MIDILGLPSLEIHRALVLSLSVALRATLLMLVALAVHGVLGRGRPLVRSVIWNACLLGLLLLPISAAAFPRLRLPAPPSPMSAVSLPAPSNLPPPDIIPTPALPVRDWSAAVLLGYAVVAAALAARLALSLLAVARLRRASPAVLEPRWVEALDRWRGRLNVARRVGLARSQRASVPVVVGWLRPVIVLPETLVESASAATIDAVLLHELAHVRRGDYAWNVLLRLVQALYWPHPLVWLIGRLIAGVREQACDDLCVAWLGGATTYCATLLEVTAGLFRRPWESLGLAMTRSTKLGRRLASLAQSPGAPRCLLRAPARGAIIVAVLAAFGLLGAVTLVRPRADEPAAKDKDQARDRRVRVERVKQGEVRRSTSQPGTVQAFESAEIFAKVSGYLKERKVDIGDRVKQGELLALIDAPELIKEAEHAAQAVAQAQVAVRQAEARLKTARSELETSAAAIAQAEAEVARTAATLKYRQMEVERFRGLHARGAVGQPLLDEQERFLGEAQAAELAAKAAVMRSRAELSAAQSRVEQAMADVQQAKSGVLPAETNHDRAQIMAGYTRIVSPYEGVVTFRGFHPGDFVRAPDAGKNIPLFRVARTDKMRVVTQVPDRDVPYLERGNPATVVLDALLGQTFRGPVARFAEAEDPQTRTMRTEIDLDNRGKTLREGMYGVVTIALNGAQSGLTIPTSALDNKDGAGRASCFRIVDGRAVWTQIRFEQLDGTRALVLDGLKDGDLVVVDPAADGVKQGEPVAVEER